MITSNTDFSFKDRKGFTSPSSNYIIVVSYSCPSEPIGSVHISARVLDEQSNEVSWFDASTEETADTITLDKAHDSVISKLAEWNPSATFSKSLNI